MGFRKFLAGASLSALALAHGAAMAQTATATDDQDDTRPQPIIVSGERLSDLLEEKATGSRLNLTALETPAAVNTVSGEDIRARGDFDFVDAVTRAPGISTVASPGNGSTALVARGFAGQSSVMQLYNGVRLVPNNSSLTFPFDTWNVERIEVLNGPGSVLYGQGALGGVVNVVPKSANFKRFEFQGQLGYGSFDTLHIAGSASAPVSDTIAVRADASYRKSDGYVDRGDSESLALSGAIEFRPDDTFSAVLRHDFGHQQPMQYFGTPLANGTTLDTSIREKNYTYLDTVTDYKDNRTQLNVEWQPLAGLTLSNITYYLDSFRKWEGLEYYSFDADAGTVTRDGNTGLYHDVQQFGIQTNATYLAQISNNVTNTLVVGFEYNRFNLNYSHNFADEYSDVVDAYNFNPGNFLNTVGIIPRYRTSTGIYAVYLEDRIELGDKFSVIGGMRYEHDRVGRWNYVYGNAGETIINETPALNGGRDAYKSFKDFTWRLGAVYQPTQTLSLYAQYVTGVDPVGNITSFTGSAAQYAFTNANGHQMEAGVKTVFMNGKGSATLAVYKLVKENLTVQRTLFDPIEQIGQQSSKGIEATVSMQLPAGFAIDVNGTVLDANYDDFPSGAISYTGNTPPNVPQTLANANLSWSPVERFQLRGSLRYVGKRFADNANSLTVPSYVMADASASIAVTEGVAVDLRVYNVFDKDYALTAAGSDGSQWILGRPRTFDVALRASF